MTSRRAVRVPLGEGPGPAELVRRAAGLDGLVVLVGDWSAGPVVLTSHPVRTTGDVAELDGTTDDLPPGFLGGGWFGRLDYDGTARFGFHDHVVRVDDDGWCFEALWSDERDAVLTERLDAWRALLDGPDATAGWAVGPVAVPPRDRHLAAVERAVELIRAGELYQVNVCLRLSAGFTGRPAGLFADLAAAVSPARGALLTDGDDALVCLSPELFLAVHDDSDGRTVRTAPIKGTLPRTGPDDGNAQRLRASAKDAAENVMIVDLMRNDLGRVCETGSVVVDSLLDVQPHPGVWHLVSTVRGRLRPEIGFADLLRATFPPGSVTGAPKDRARAAIAGLEHSPRGAYTGAVGYVGVGGAAEFAVTIRAFEIAAGRLELGVGGGVTADSVPMLEWRECLHKAAPLLAEVRVEADPAGFADLLETVLVLDGVPVRLPDHLARLDRSCRELTSRGLPLDLHDRALACAATLPRGRGVLRIVLTTAGPVLTAAALGPPPDASRAVTRLRPPGSWRHKWADRTALVEAEQACGSDVPLFVAADGSVLETSRGNVFLVREDGGLVTAPLRDDLLPGVTRRTVLDAARGQGRPSELRGFTVDELRGRPAFWTSSLSGVVPIRSVDGVALPAADDVVTRLSVGIGFVR